MAEEIAFENGRVSNFEGLVNLTLDQVILHTIVHLNLHAKFRWNQRNFWWTNERTHVRTYVQMDIWDRLR